jgi:hypothetical protein
MHTTRILSQKKPYVKKLSLVIKRAMREKAQEYKDMNPEFAPIQYKSVSSYVTK